MLKRVSFWALTGAAVAFSWFFYFTWLTWGAYHGGSAFRFGLTTQTLANATVPCALLGLHYHFAITWYVSVLLNAASYACIGLAVEGLRRTFHPAFARLRH